MAFVGFERLVFHVLVLILTLLQAVRRLSSASVIAWHVLQSFAFRDNFLDQINYHCRNDERADDCGADPEPSEVVFGFVVIFAVAALIDGLGIGEGVFEDVSRFVGGCCVVFGSFDLLNVDVVEH